MLTPYTLARSMFEELADSAFGNHNSSGLMRTDIRETETRYEVAIDLAGIKKENLTIELKNGNLVISAIVEQDPVPEGEKFRYLRRERFVGTMQRSFYVGEKVRQEDIHAKYENGTLYLIIQKEIPVPQIESRNLIAIEDYHESVKTKIGGNHT